MKDYLLVLLICHTLGDYYLQTQQLALKKDKHPKSLRLHLTLYAAPFLAMVFLHQLSTALLLAGTIAALCHAFIDLSKARLSGRAGPAKKDPAHSGRVYIIDQTLHWVSLIAIAYLFRGAPPILAWPFLNDLAGEFNLTWHLILQWSLALLLIYRPSNITFTRLFSSYKPAEADARASGGDPAIPAGSSGEKLRTGGIIGVLEKLLALIFLASDQYMAIGLVLTAKSIARYDKISKSPSFAEYYLIGTLSSILLVLLIDALCFQMLA